jgi:hypothetical protein
VTDDDLVSMEGSDEEREDEDDIDKDEYCCVGKGEGTELRLCTWFF